MLSVFRFYGARNLRLTKGYMQYVWDDGGRKYLDANNGHGVAFLGHSNPFIVEAVSSQLSTLVSPGLSFYNNLEDKTAESLSRIAPESHDTVFFLNTGGEAVKVALKIAWAYTGKRKIIAFKNSFHGRTLGALSVTWNPRYRKGFPVLNNVVFAQYNSDCEELY